MELLGVLSVPRRKVMLDLTWAVIWICWIVSPALRRPEFDHCSVHWECVVDKLLLVQALIVYFELILSLSSYQ